MYVAPNQYPCHPDVPNRWQPVSYTAPNYPLMSRPTAVTKCRNERLRREASSMSIRDANAG